MKRYSILAGLIGLLLVLGASEAAAQRGQGRGGGWRSGGGGDGFGPGMSATLNLSDQQRGEIERLRNEMYEDNKPVLDSLDSLRAQMQKLWALENPDENEIAALHNKMDPLRKELRERKTQFRLEVLDLLNSKQRAAYRNLVGKGGCMYGAPGRGRGRRHGKGRGNGYGRGQGGYW
jgi:Spy/CpxP family protein refolding chaperone